MRKSTGGWLVLAPMTVILSAAFMTFAAETRTVSTVADLVQALDDLKDDASNIVILSPSNYDVSGCAMLCNDADKAKYLWSTSHIAISKLTLRGGGQTARDTVIYGNGTQRILYAWQGKIQNLTISNGCTRATEPGLGGGILARNESTQCSNVVVTCCSAKAAGGIANAASIGCEVSDCTSDTHGGGVYTTSYFRNGKLLHNHAGTYGGGAASCVISNSCLWGNRAGTYGGGGFNTKIFDSILAENIADRSGGGLAYNLDNTVDRCTVVSNRTECLDSSSDNEAYGSGGGIWVTGSPSVTISDCLIADNEGIHRGGGVKGGGSLGTVLQRCIISNNVLRGRATYTKRTYGGGCDQCRVYDSQILFNLVTSDYCSTVAGGGMSFGSASNCIVRGNAVAMCKATNKMGGAGYENAFTNCVIVDNFALVGGAINGGNATFCCFSNNVTPTGTLTLRATKALEDCAIHNAVIDSPGAICRTSICGYGAGWTLAPGANVYTNGYFAADASAYVLKNTQATATYATNCLFAGNTCKGLVSRPADAYPVTPFVNCTITGNRFDWMAVGFSPDYQVTVAEFVNSIIACNSNMAATAALDFAVNNTVSTNISFVNCMIGPNRFSPWTPLYESGTITSDDPRFDKSNALHPYSLKLSSPAVGKGFVQPWMADAYDIRGLADDGKYHRLRDGKVDLGCYQCWLDPVGTALLFR